MRECQIIVKSGVKVLVHVKSLTICFRTSHVLILCLKLLMDFKALLGKSLNKCWFFYCIFLVNVELNKG